MLSIKSPLQKSCCIIGALVTSLLLGMIFGGCTKPKHVEPVVQQSLAKTLEQAYPNAQHIFGLGPFGGEMGIENLIEFDLSVGKNTNEKIHLIGRDFLQTEAEHTRLLEFLSQKANHQQFLSSIAFPHHNPWIDPVQAEAVHITCLNQKIPAIQLQFMQASKWQSGWLLMLPYVLKHPWLQYRLIWLLVIGNEEPANRVLLNITNLPALTQNLLPPDHDSVNHVFFGNPCHP